MGVDMYALSPRSVAPSGWEPSWRDDEPWAYRLNWNGMGKMIETLGDTGVLDFEMPEPRWPKWPGEEHFRERDEVGPDADWWEPISPIGKRYAEDSRAVRFTLAEHGKVPVFKFGSNDSWVVTPPECLWLAEALHDRLQVLDPTERWTLTVAGFADFNERCATGADGYRIA